MARIFGWVVLIAFLIGVFATVLPSAGPMAFVMIGVVAALTFAVVWAVGAIIYEDWWPFRYL
jgi:hypothetical protein